MRQYGQRIHNSGAVPAHGTLSSGRTLLYRTILERFRETAGTLDRPVADANNGSRRSILTPRPLDLKGEVPPLSRIERMTLAAARISPQRIPILRVLLEATNPANCGGRPVLRPLWAYEAMQRAYNLVHLIADLDTRVPANRYPVAVKLETKIANALGRSYRELDIIDDKDLLPSSGVLRTIAQNMVELFGPSVGDVVTAFELTRLSLPAFKRRALVLACNELLVNVLQHAFDGRSSGLIVVTLRDLGGGRASLLVADSGRGMGSAIRSPHWGVAADLAELLDGELLYSEAARGGTVAELRFRTDPETVQNPGVNMDEQNLSTRTRLPQGLGSAR
jgi:hypothetical protein